MESTEINASTEKVAESESKKVSELTESPAEESTPEIANKPIEQIDPKEQVEELLEQYKARCKELEEEKAKCNEELRDKDVIITNMHKIMQEGMEAKEKEVTLLREKYESADFDLGVSFKIFALDSVSESEIQELTKLREENTNLIKSVNEAKELVAMIDKDNRAVGEYEEKCKVLQSEIDDLKSRHANELAAKNELIKKLESVNSGLEVKLAQVAAAEKIQRQKAESANAVIDQNQKELIELEASKSEIQNEIRALVVQCKERDKEITQRGIFINKQQQEMEELHAELRQIDAEKSALQKQNARLANILKEKRVQLSNANLKIKEINTSVILELKSSLEDRERTISMLKEIIKGHNAEINVKNRDIARFKKSLGKVKSQKASIGQHVTNRTSETEAKLAQASVNSPIIKKVEFTPEVNKKKLLDESTETYSPPSFKTPVTYQAKYAQIIDKYLNEVHDVNYRNNSSNVRNALCYKHNVIIKNSSEAREGVRIERGVC
eukprot:TRINITY_DN4100_c0_g4_i1.p1 TRINITY_DN4100_c0_g4~~TRINITY_DN4100_c0_g4_i1.p1  ORF type:complete len:498 (-),score=145.61 TRINITY_DN4100_c0_g4_i1:245-1738(-)